MNNDDIKSLAEFIQADEINKQNKYEGITKKALALFNKKQIIEFIDTYNNQVTSIADKIEALGTLFTEILEKENWDSTKILKFREQVFEAPDKCFVYLVDNAMFQAGVISPEEFIQSIEDGIKKQIPLAFVIKSFFYKYGLEFYGASKQAIEKAIMLEPNNLEYKNILKCVEVDKAMNDDYDSEPNM